MTVIVRYGSNCSLQLESACDGRVREYGCPCHQPLTDCPRAVQAALAEPLGYPPLADITTADDRITVAVGTPLPCGAEIVAAVVRSLSDSGVDPRGITVLQQASQAQIDDICRLLPDNIRTQICTAHHDPTARGSMAYLATTDAGEPVVLNRLLTDADLVLPIGCVQDAAASGYFGINSPLFPGFSDEETQSRFRRDDAKLNNKLRLTRDVDEVGWLLGVCFSIQVVPGGGDDVLHIVAGRTDQVRDHAQRLFSEAWPPTLATAAKLVVATIEGGRDEQSWHNLGRAVASAAALTEPDGAVAVLCELADEPGRAVRHLAQARSREAALREIRNLQPDDALPAMQIVAAMKRNHLYLMSRLDDELVEDLDIMPIASPAELNRLVGRVTQSGGTCILLSNAARAKVGMAAGNRKSAADEHG